MCALKIVHTMQNSVKGVKWAPIELSDKYEAVVMM